MHRHGYIGRKFGREKGQRIALKRGLMRSLVEHKSIKTTLPKAKEIRRPMEKIITAAKKGGLANRRRVIAALDSIELGNLLVDKIALQIKRNSGYLRVVKLDEYRTGDNAPMARIEFVDEFTEEKPTTESKSTDKKEAKASETKTEKASSGKTPKQKGEE